MGVKKRPNQPKNFGKTSRTPRRPFEKERLEKVEAYEKEHNVQIL